MKQILFVVVLTAFVLSACGAPAPSPTDTPVLPTTTPIPPGPKIGHWVGTEPPVSFDVTNEGYVRNFSITIPFALGECTITIDNVEILTDGTFVFSEMAPTNSGEFKEVNRFSGKFDNTTELTGSYGKLLMCGVDPDRWVSMSKEEGKWKAEWKNP